MSQLSLVRVVINYVLADYKRNKKSFAIGASTVFLVVLFLSLIQNALNQSNLVFLKLAEDQVGAYDLLLTPDIASIQPSSSATFNPFLNYKYINDSIKGYSDVTGAAARWIWNVNVSRTDMSSNQRPLSVTLFVMDTEFEKNIGLAQSWPYRPLDTAEIHVSASLLRALNVFPNAGERLRIQTDGLSFLGISGSNVSSLLPDSINIPIDAASNLPPQILPLLNLTNGQNLQTTITINPRLLLQANNNTLGNNGFNIVCTVIDSIDGTYGKYPSALGNVIVMDKAYLQQLINNPINLLFGGNANSLTTTNLNISLDSLAMSIVVNVNNRASIYASPSDERKKIINTIADEVFYRIGVDYKVNAIDVLSKALDATRFIQLFLDDLFFKVLFVLSILSIVLVTSLLLSDAEEKTFEYGILRSLGLQSWSLILLLCLQSLMFAIPGIITGLTLCFIVFIPVAYFLTMYVGYEIQVALSSSAILLGVLLGLVLPIIGVVVPIRRSLSKTIRDSLDIYHNVVFDTKISVIKIENVRLSLTSTIVSILLIVLGVMVYYLIPLAFTLGDLQMFFRILSIIFLGMFLGMVMMSDAMQMTLQKAFINLLTWIFNDWKMKAIVIKNAGGHVSRNRKTALMFTLCLGYLIFAATAFQLQIGSFSSNLEWVSGSDISVSAQNFEKPLPEEKLREFLEKQKSSQLKIVQSYTFVSFHISSYFPVANAQISRISPINVPRVFIYGLEENFLDAAFSKFFSPSEINYEMVGGESYLQALNRTLNLKKTEPVNILNTIVRQGDFAFGQNASAYTQAFPVFVSEALRDAGNVDVYSDLILTVNTFAVGRKSYLCKPILMLKKFPSFPAISRLNTRNTPVLVSMYTLKKILNDLQLILKRPRFETVPKQNLLIKLVSNVSAREVEAFVNELNNVVADGDFRVQDLISRIANTKMAANFLMIIFYIVSIIGIIFSFFVLYLSFTANVRENSWELGVLRAIGLTKFQVIRLYIYEALSIIFSSILLGTTLGITIAIAIQLQTNLFDELPFTFTFPIFLYLLVVISSVGFAVLGSYFPIVVYTKKPIAIVLRG